MLKELAFLLVLCTCSAAVLQVQEASAHNEKIASSLLGAKNACIEEKRQPSLADVFSVAQIKIVTLIPQVENVTSDQAEPKLLWSWSADFPDSATFLLDATTECPAGFIEIFSPGNASLTEAKLVYHYGQEKKEILLKKDGPNPVMLELDSSRLLEKDFEQFYAVLQTKLSGKVSVEYSYRKTEYRLVCQQVGEFEVCGCEAKVSLGNQAFEKNLEDEREFFVEIGPVQELWLNPPLQKRLQGIQDGKIVLFARRMPSRISISSNGEKLGSASIYSFEKEVGKCRQMTVKSSFEPKGENLEVEKANKTVFPFQLVEKNASYLPFYAEFVWDSEKGKKAVQILFEDWFLGNETFSRDFSVRQPGPFFPNQSKEIALIPGTDEMPPAAYPAIESKEKRAELPDVAIVIVFVGVVGAIAAVMCLMPLWSK